MTTHDSAARVAAVRRFGPDPITEDQRTRAAALLVDLLDAAALHGVTLDDLDNITDLPGACVDAITANDRRDQYRRDIR